MKAILALTARYAAISQVVGPSTPPAAVGSRAGTATTPSNNPPVTIRSANNVAEPINYHALAIQYYYETLHYVQTALHFNSYAHSEEILATAIIISTYEMLDESASNWQRHLKGVFWIQRGQNVNGGSGGLRQAVWWAWLRQDLWAGFRERRKCFSFWRPDRGYDELSQDELACRSIYLLSQAVNYCAVGETNPAGDISSSDPEVIRRRARAADELMGLLERWKGYLGAGFRPLPTSRTNHSISSQGANGEEGADEEDVFQPIWIHPPRHAVAMQVYCFAKILITLHKPPEPGFGHYMKTQVGVHACPVQTTSTWSELLKLDANRLNPLQRTLSESVTMICGIAMALTDETCQIISAHCLFGGKLCLAISIHCIENRLQANIIQSLFSWTLCTR
jgi:hypothetical protein